MELLPVYVTAALLMAWAFAALFACGALAVLCL